MFLDERLIVVRSGAGGDGAVAWRREKFVPRGGPAGGDGGRGGDVVLLADANLTTFADMVQDRVVRAESGGRGGGDPFRGAGGEDRGPLLAAGAARADRAGRARL